MRIAYTVIYTDRKTIALTVKNEAVIVRAPYNTSERYIAQIVENHRDWIISKLALQWDKSHREEGLSKDEISHLKQSAVSYFNNLVEKYSKIMGLKCGRVKITSAKKRFGSCNRDGTICFSYRLMLYPEDAREYVVVHELAHLIEMNHSKAFYAIIERYMPDYKRRKKLLS